MRRDVCVLLSLLAVQSVGLLGNKTDTSLSVARGSLKRTASSGSFDSYCRRYGSTQTGIIATQSVRGRRCCGGSPIDALRRNYEHPGSPIDHRGTPIEHPPTPIDGQEENRVLHQVVEEEIFKV